MSQSSEVVSPARAAPEDAPGPGGLVVLGGGTGISATLAGIKRYTEDVVAIVTVADDGGSSGRLRKDYHMLPPGDIRNCLVALSSSEPILADLFSYRFEDSILRGHSFGNLFLAVLTRLSGDFRHAVERARDLLHVKGRVIPSTDTRVVLVATHGDGTKSTGEQCISRCAKPITGLELRPPPPPISDEIRDAVMQAEVVVIGPGSLFTSLIPNLLVPGMVEALEATPAKVVVVTNLMTQPGETDRFDLGGHLSALREIGGLRRLDLAIVNTGEIPEEFAARYRTEGARTLELPPGTTAVGGVPVLSDDLVKLTRDGHVRHDPDRLAALIWGLRRGRATEGAPRD